MELTILKDIVIIFALSVFVNFVFTKMRIPSVVGYLLTGVIAGPHLLGLVHAQHDIELLAEIGVVLLLFTIGMEFSLKHLLKIRRIVFFGGMIQVFLTALAVYGVSRFYDLDWQAGVFIGFLAGLSSSALVLKILQERSDLSSNYGRTVLGILIFQDILLVPLLLFTNLIGDSEADISYELLVLLVKTIIIIGVVFVGNKWLLPWLLHQIAKAKNQELFMMSILLICLGIALLTHQMGMSLAFGAFLAGLMISESEYSHNAFGNLIPFKNIFTTFFFVSIGMLLNLSFVIDQYSVVLLSVFLLITVKTIIAGGTGFLLGHTLRGTIMIGLALSQVGEFSFILAKVGFDQDIISEYYYQLFLAVTVITMAITPFLIKFARPLADQILKLPISEKLKDGLFPLNEMEVPGYKNHLVIIGKDPSALKLSIMAKYYQIEHVSVIFDPILARDKMKKGDIVVYGDAINTPVLMKANVDQADIVIISIGDLIASMATIQRVKEINPNVHIIIRAKHINNIKQLYETGANQVFPEKLEIAINLFNMVLSKRLYPQTEINRRLAKIRSINLGMFNERDIINKPSILDEFSNINISAVKVDKDAPVDGKTIAEMDLRKKTGVTLLALKRGDKVIKTPKPKTTLLQGDTAYLLGDPEQITLASELFS